MLRVGCGNSVRNHRPQWPLSPASRFQVGQVARSIDGRLVNARLRAISTLITSARPMATRLVRRFT